MEKFWKQEWQLKECYWKNRQKWAAKAKLQGDYLGELKDLHKDVANWTHLNEPGTMTCPDIREYVKKHLGEWRGWHGTFEIKGFESPVELWIYGDREKTMQRTHLQLAIEYILISFLWVYHVLRKLDPQCRLRRGRRSQPKSMTIVLWWTPLKKRWSPESTELLGPCQVNSGQTSFSDSRRSISIWRYQEWSKIWIHELLHALNWDSFVKMASPGCKVHVNWRQRLMRNKWHEMWTELWAVWLHVLFSAQCSFRKAETLWHDEYEHMTRQAHCLDQRGTTLKFDRSAVWSYFVLKYAMVEYGPTMLDLACQVTKAQKPVDRLCEITRAAWRCFRNNRDTEQTTQCPLGLKMTISAEFASEFL